MTLIQVRDTDLHYERRGAGEPLLLLMGMSGNTLHWGEPFLMAIERRFDVIAYDHRGTGLSAPLGSDPLTIAQMADDAAGLLRALGLESAHVFGISMGGMVGQQLALRHPEMVRSLGLGATYCGGEGALLTQKDVEDRLAAATFSGDREQSIRTRWEVNVSARFARLDARYAEYRTIVLREPTAIQVIMAQMRAIAEHDTSAELGKIKAPVLVVHGTEDEMLPFVNGPLIAKRIPGSRLEALDAGHLFFWEHPERIAELIGELTEESAVDAAIARSAVG